VTTRAIDLIGGWVSSRCFRLANREKDTDGENTTDRGPAWLVRRDPCLLHAVLLPGWSPVVLACDRFRI
jgi:hypothetical protein